MSTQAAPAKAPQGRPARRRSSRGTSGFRQRNALSLHSMHFGPNMTPMVDVVMVILIFFMASAAFLGAEWFLKAAIPFNAGRGPNALKPNDPLALPPTRLEALMDADASGAGTVVSFLDLKRVPLQQFLDRVAALPKDEQTRQLEIVIKPTARVPYRDVVTAHSACDAAGIYKVGIGVTKSADQP